MHTFIDSFVGKEYESSGISKDISRKSFGDLGAFLHVVLFMSWSHSVCKFEKPPVEYFRRIVLLENMRGRPLLRRQLDSLQCLESIDNCERQAVHILQFSKDAEHY